MFDAYDITGATINEYDGFNQLVKTSSENTTATYTYNCNGLRTSKTVNGEVTVHIWNGDQMVMELDSSGAVKAKYVRGINLLYRENDFGFRNYYLFNGHGDVVHLTGDDGNVTKTYDYDAFGNEKNADIAEKDPFRCSGEYFDLSSGIFTEDINVLYNADIRKVINPETGSRVTAIVLAQAGPYALAQTSEIDLSPDTDPQCNTANILILKMSKKTDCFTSFENSVKLNMQKPNSSKLSETIVLNPTERYAIARTPEMDLSPNTVYILEFEYWAEEGNTLFYTDLSPDDIPRTVLTPQNTVQKAKIEINSGSMNMHSAYILFVSRGSGHVYITNVLFYKKSSLGDVKQDNNPFRYCGEYFDKETGTIYLRARYYDPATSRMLTEDSYPGDPKDPLSLNLYTYCNNNPVMCFLRGTNEIILNSNKSV